MTTHTEHWRLDYKDGVAFKDGTTQRMRSRRIRSECISNQCKLGIRKKDTHVDVRVGLHEHAQLVTAVFGLVDGEQSHACTTSPYRDMMLFNDL